MNRRAPDRVHEQGFTLIELLVSLAILAVALAVLLVAVSDSLGRVRINRDEDMAGALAQSLLARAGVEQALHPGVTRGVYSNGFGWQLSVDLYGNDDDAKAWGVAAYRVTATVLWREGRQNLSRSLTSLRMVPPARPPA